MRAQAIFGPVSVLALWTLLVLAMTGSRRVRGALSGRVPRNAFRLGESAEVPPDIAVVNRNFMNLLEVPVLFYVVCISLYVTRQVNTAMVTLAWVYVLLRVVHSFIHLTSNRIMQRLMVFAASNFVLLAIWLWFLWRVY
jgi:hypothetical protein